MPIIKYKTDIDLEDESKIRDEVNKIHDIVMEMYPDLEVGYSTFLYEAFEDYPIIPTKLYRSFKVIYENE